MSLHHMWPQTYSNPPASVSRVPGLQVYSTPPDLWVMGLRQTIRGCLDGSRHLSMEFPLKTRNRATT